MSKGGGGGGGSTTTVQKADPWAGVQPYLSQAYGQASNLYTGPGPQFFQGQTVAGPNPLEGYGQQLQLSQLGNMGQAGQMGLSGLAGLTGGVDYAGAGGQNALAAGDLLNSAYFDYSNLGSQLLGPALGNIKSQADFSNLFGKTGLMDAFGRMGTAGTLAGQAGGEALQLGLGGANQLAGGATEAGGIGIGQGLNRMQQIGDWASSMSPGALGSAIGGLQTLYNQGGAQAGSAGALQGMQGLLAAGDPMNNPYLASAMQAAIRPVTEQFQETVLPGIRQGAQAAGQMGGSRQGIAEGIAARGLQNTIGDITAGMGSQAYGQGLQAMQAGAGIGQGLLGAGMEQLGAVGGLGQGLAGLGLSAGQGLGSLGANLFGQAGDLRGLQAGTGTNLSGQNLAAAQGMGNLAQDQYGLGAALQGQLFGAGQNMYGLGLNALGQSGQLGQGMYGEGMTAAGRGLALMPGLQQALGMPGMTAERIGQQLTSDQQQQIDAEMQRWNYNQQLPFNMVSDYLGLLQGAQGGMTSASTQGGGSGRSPLMGAMGGALTGAGIGSAFPVVGTGLGALIGGAGGLLGLF